MYFESAVSLLRFLLPLGQPHSLISFMKYLVLPPRKILIVEKKTKNTLLNTQTYKGF